MRFVILFFLILHFPSLIAQLNLEAAENSNDLITAAARNSRVMGISSGIVMGSETHFEYAGYADENRTREFNANTITRIASVVKPMTAVAVMQLVEKGKIDLDAPIQTYLPDFPEKEEGVITTRQLLGHFAGIPAYKGKKEINNTEHYNSLTDASKIFKDRPLDFTPGSEYGYSTYGFVVVGMIVEATSGVSFSEYMHEHIFAPAGMSNTSVEEVNNLPMSKSELFQSNGKGKLLRLDLTDLSDRVPGGGVQSTVADVLKFGRAILKNELITEDSFNDLIRDTGMKRGGSQYGLGFYLYGINPTYGNVVGHTGGQLGCSAQLFILPEQEAVVFVASNTSNAMDIVSTAAIALFDMIP